MRSIKTKITAMTVCAVVLTMAIATALGVNAIRDIGNYNAEQTLLLLCEKGHKDLDYYFQNVESSVKTVAAFVQSDLDGVDDEDLQAHIDRVSDVFQKLAYNTIGVLTYYYRIDPEVSGNVKGFWYVNSDGNGFIEHEVTDITEYDTDDTSSLVWFTVPKATGEGVWLPPYITENLYARVISYNVPVYYDGQFIGVIGIEIDYSTMAEVVNHITLYDHGYAFLNDDEGNIVYHPQMDVTTMETQPQVPSGLLSNDQFIRYFYDGVEKRAACLPLSNGMRLVVTVPVQEINAAWHKWITKIAIVFDIRSLNDMAYVDALTRIGNRHALRRDYNSYQGHEVTVAMMDMDDFKQINDTRGHEEGDRVLQEVGKLLSDTFGKEYCYRYGGDEFLLIVPDISISEFNEKLGTLEQNKPAIDGIAWAGFSVGFVRAMLTDSDMLRNLIARADEKMYESKHEKNHLKENEQ